jgi:tetraacyldisaccharide 4'-kinase
LTVAARHRRVVSGEARGLGASLVRAALVPPSWLYGTAVAVRNLGYDLGFVRPRRLGLPAIAVGNLTAGGTGKTPFTHWLVAEILRRGARPAVLSRGYGASAALGGRNDETLLLERLFPGILHFEGADRRSLGRAAIRAGAQVLVLDDALQHRPVMPHLAIALIDATEPFGYGRLLPRGLLREPVRTGLGRVDVAIVTRADQVPREEVERVRGELERLSPHLPTGVAVHRPVALEVEAREPAGGKRARSDEPSSLRGRRVYLFSGLANPGAFEATARGLGAEVVGHDVRPDHEPHPPTVIEAAAARARGARADLLLTTRKDRVRMLPPDVATEPELAVLDVEMAILDGRRFLDEALDRLAPSGGVAPEVTDVARGRAIR